MESQMQCRTSSSKPARPNRASEQQNLSERQQGGSRNRSGKARFQRRTEEMVNPV